MVQVLLEEVNPFGTARALVEADGRTVYAYLLPVDSSVDWGMRAVWVGNEIDTSSGTFDVREQMAEGVAPVVDAKGCALPYVHRRPTPDDLSVVWWPAGDGLFLLEREVLVAVVPPWADATCPGYSRAAAIKTLVAWPLAGTDLNAALANARGIWHEERLEFAPLQQAVMGAVEAAAGPSQRYWQIDGGQWPLCGATIHKPSGDVGPSLAVTVGMSLMPMPSRGLDIDAIELAVCADGDDEGCVRMLAGFARYPWTELTWLGAGHTLTCDRVRPSTWPYAAALLVRASELAPLALLGEIQLPNARSASVMILVPISAEERATATNHGSQTLLTHLRTENPWWFLRR